MFLSSALNPRSIKAINHIRHFSTLREYCKGINIASPKHELYDIRSFEENMKTVHARMPHFRHEFYAIALKLEGGGFVTTGNHDTKDLRATIFFNSPYQILHWDIAPDWKGYYVIFTEEFYQQSLPNRRLTEQFTFLLSDNTTPLKVEESESAIFYKIFDDIYAEHHFKQVHQTEIILHYIQVLLLKTARLYYKQGPAKAHTTHQRNNDLHIVSRFKALIETAFYPGKLYTDRSPHQVQYYADKLNIHPNHLNALVKRITGSAASDMIQNHMLTLATAQLKNTSLSVKEIAYSLYFNYPNHFSAFFKKQTNLSPNAFRKS